MISLEQKVIIWILNELRARWSQAGFFPEHLNSMSFQVQGEKLQICPPVYFIPNQTWPITFSLANPNLIDQVWEFITSLPQNKLRDITSIRDDDLGPNPDHR